MISDAQVHIWGVLEMLDSLALVRHSPHGWLTDHAKTETIYQTG